MAKTLDHLPQHEGLATIGRTFYQRGWMAGTAGNLSARDKRESNRFWITASGLPKGCLESTDLVQICIDDGHVLHRGHESAHPSAESSIHRTIYRLFPDANACLHIHSIDACIATQRATIDANQLRLPPLEMLKGVGIWEQNPDAALALFDNLPDVPAIAREIEIRFRETPPAIPALMIRNHGITVWGDSLQQAYNRVEIIEFIMSYLARLPS